MSFRLVVLLSIKFGCVTQHLFLFQTAPNTEENQAPSVSIFVFHHYVTGDSTLGFIGVSKPA